MLSVHIVFLQLPLIHHKVNLLSSANLTITGGFLPCFLAPPSLCAVDICCSFTSKPAAAASLQTFSISWSSLSSPSCSSLMPLIHTFTFQLFSSSSSSLYLHSRMLLLIFLSSTDKSSYFCIASTIAGSAALMVISNILDCAEVDHS